MKQAMEIGILLQFESLLSCHGDEMGMIEDMAVGVSDLSNVAIYLNKADKVDWDLPQLSGSRSATEFFYVNHAN